MPRGEIYYEPAKPEPECEPWVNLATARELQGWNLDHRAVYNWRNRQAQKHTFFTNAFDYLHDNSIEGDYYEFGCHRARTFRMALTEATRQCFDKMHFWAFDSFQGLPPAESYEHPLWKPGALCTTPEEFWAHIKGHGFGPDRVHTVEGFYADTLTDARRDAMGDSRAAIVTVDCDLYDSSAAVFRFIDPLLQPGAVVYLDDLFTGKGMAKAFAEYRAWSRWDFLEHLHVGWWGRSYIATERP